MSQRPQVSSVQVRMADGSEHTIPYHGITQMDFIRLVQGTGAKTWEDLGLRSSTPTLQGISFIITAVAECLSFPQTQDLWTSERVMKSFGNMDEVAKIFMEALRVSGLDQAGKVQKP